MAEQVTPSLYSVMAPGPSISVTGKRLLSHVQLALAVLPLLQRLMKASSVTQNDSLQLKCKKNTADMYFSDPTDLKLCDVAQQELDQMINSCQMLILSQLYHNYNPNILKQPKLTMMKFLPSQGVEIQHPAWY